jgi:type VI secretion system protein ImpF
VAELLAQEKLQPALLDRLLDDEPDKKQEARERRVITRGRLREAVLRDLTWLLNSTRMGGPESLAGYDEVQRSVVNYGLPPLSGETAATVDLWNMERSIRQAILDFEPRILPASLQVEALTTESLLDHHNIISIQIRGSLWAQPLPLELLLRTDLDLETGAVQVRDLGKPA